MPNTDPKSAAAWKARRDKCKRKRKELIDSWSVSVDYLRGKPFQQESDEDRVYVNVDWSMSRRKATQLASQMPEVRLETRIPELKPVLPEFARRVNHHLREAGVGDAMYETTVDCINASGFGVVLCGYEARTEPTQVPALEEQLYAPEVWQQMLATGQVPMIDSTRVVDKRFYADRKSPSDFLWPLEFTGSNFDKASWVGHSGRKTWPEAQPEFNLKEEDREKICGSGGRQENLRDTEDQDSNEEDGIVEYDEIFYWRARFDPAEKNYHAIWRIVFVSGLDEPVIDESWKGQKLQNGKYGGACKFPLRVLTLNYVSDDPIPPSDSAIARPQVNELIRSRTQMVLQRTRSMPLRWHDVNRVDPTIADNLMRGTWQGSIPVSGNGSSIIGEVARANYPAEDFEFDRIVKADISESWQVGANQLGNFNAGDRTASEANIVQANFATQAGYARARVAAFFCGIAEVIAGLDALYGDPIAPPASGDPNAPPPPPVDPTMLSTAFSFSVLPDSTVLLDAGQKTQRLERVLNLIGKSGLIDPQPLVDEIMALNGVDPLTVKRLPEPPKEEPLNISYRFSGTEDLTNPIVLAMLIKAGQAPSPDELKAAAAILEAVRVMPGLPPPLPREMPPPPKAEAPAAGDSNPAWTGMSTITKRKEE